jgi:ABC-type sugar transport system permease subunit
MGLPVALEDAAYIDGAGPYRTFFSIMLPNVKNAIIRSINNTMFSLFKFGYASAMSVVYFLVIIIILGLVALLLRRFIIYQE